VNITHGGSFATRRCRFFSLPARASLLCYFPMILGKKSDCVIRHAPLPSLSSTTMKSPFWNFLVEVFGESDSKPGSV